MSKKAIASGKCSVCHGRFNLRQDGTMRAHGVAEVGGISKYRRCRGTYLLPEPGSWGRPNL